MCQTEQKLSRPQSSVCGNRNKFQGSEESSRKQEMERTRPPPGEFGLKRWKLQDFVPSLIRPYVPFHVWNAFLLGHAHVLGFYGLYIGFSGITPKFLEGMTFLTLYGYLGGIGVTAGAHRLWTHRSYKANKPLQVILMLMQSSVLQYPVIKWVRDHRIHHKYTDTDADPHSAARGFWFSHMGWVITPEHPEVVKKEKTIPMQDIEDDPILDFQASSCGFSFNKHYWSLTLLTLYLIPIGLMMIFFPQPLFHIICLNYSRWIIMTHVAGCVNSVAHIFGDKPYDKSMSAVENRLLSIFTVGEAWHNYHHTFPYDYKTSELPFYTFNVSTAFIDFFAWLGWATELKTVPQQMIDERARRTGDGSHHSLKSPSGEIEPARINGKVASWGWGDKDMGKEADAVSRFLKLAKIS